MVNLNLMSNLMLPLILVIMKLKYAIISLPEKETLDIHSFEAFTDHKTIYLKVPGNKALLPKFLTTKL